MADEFGELHFHYAAMYFIELDAICSTTSLSIALYCVVLYTVLYCIVFYCIVLYCIVSYCIVLYCIVLSHLAMCCIVLYLLYCICIALYCILYCIVLLLAHLAMIGLMWFRATAVEDVCLSPSLLSSLFVLRVMPKDICRRVCF